MTIYEIEKKTKYFAADLILEDCLDNDGEIDFDKALKKNPFQQFRMWN